MPHSLGRKNLPTSHPALFVSQCGMPCSCIVAAMCWVSTHSMQSYYVQLLILVALRREHRLVAWKHPPSCSELTSSNVLVQHLLEDPPYPIALRQTFSGAQHYYRLQICLSVPGGYLGTRLGSILHYNQSGSSPGPSFTGILSNNTSISRTSPCRKM
jgi:hypothetical protein